MIRTAKFRLAAALCAILFISTPLLAQVAKAQPGESDNALKAMRDEMERSRARLQLNDLERPYYLEYRLVDIGTRTVTASFGAILSSTAAHNRLMSVEVRVGDYRLDSSNFVSNDQFQGFIGNTGTVGIDGDYESLRQDLWLATDQAYKSALDSISRKRAYLRNLSRQSDIDDFSKEPPIVLLQPQSGPEWGRARDRDWEAEAKTASAAFRAHPELHSSRVTYHLVYVTQYLVTSEGTQIRTSRNLSSVEASLDSQTNDGMRLHNFYSAYANRPSELPAVGEVTAGVERASKDLVALRSSPPAQDYVGPVLFEAPAAGALLSQVLGPSISGARPPLSMLPFFDQMMERMGGRSEWSGKLGTRVLPAGVSLVDDPTAKEYQGKPLLGTYEVDDEGVRAQRVILVDNGMLRGFLMSRRPGPDFQQSNGHGRAALLSEAKPAVSNFFFQASETVSPADLRRKFLELCRAEGRQWCIVIRQMDNPALGFLRQQDFSDVYAGLAGGATSGDRAPLLVYRVNAADGREELVRGGWLTGINLRGLRNLAGIGNDFALYHFYQDPRLAGTALGAFGSSQNGLPSSLVAPSLLLSEAEVRGSRREPRRAPLLPPPPLN